MGSCCSACTNLRTNKHILDLSDAVSTNGPIEDTYSTKLSPRFDTIGKVSTDSDLPSDDVDSDFGSELDFIFEDDDTIVDPEEIVRVLTPVDRPYQTSRLGRHSVDTPATIMEETDEGSESDDVDSDDGEHKVIKWKKGNRIGKGSFGTVWCGLTSGGELIAVKEIEIVPNFPQADKEYDKICEEVELLRTLDHKNIVRYLGSSYCNSTISIFMQYIPGGCLASIILRFGALEEPVTSRYTRQILKALVYLHANNVIHRDIKSGNILLMPDGTVKLIDFGCAKRLCTKLGQHGSNLQKSLRGTPYWMAPEVINESGHGKGSDVWSLGCTVFEMCTGKTPWGDREPLAAMFAVGAELPMPCLPETFSSECKDFVSSCLIRDKRKRPSAAKLQKHEFVARKRSQKHRVYHR